MLFEKRSWNWGYGESVSGRVICKVGGFWGTSGALPECLMQRSLQQVQAWWGGGAGGAWDCESGQGCWAFFPQELWESWAEEWCISITVGTSGGGPLVRIRSLPTRGPRFDPWSGSLGSHMLQPKSPHAPEDLHACTNWKAKCKYLKKNSLYLCRVERRRREHTRSQRDQQVKR